MLQLEPKSIAELTRSLAEADRTGQRIASVRLHALHRLLEHVPEDMTATVESGMTLSALQNELAAKNQWLPLDPPFADRLTIGELLDTNAQGPRRFGQGLARDYVIGLKAVLADGRLISSGGKVVKNVAGFDLAKLFIGSRQTLGIIVEATFKLKPKPETERFVQATVASLKEARALIERVLDSDLQADVLDLHNLASGGATQPPAFVLVLGLAGSQTDVEAQLQLAAQLGVGLPSSLDHDSMFWTLAAGKEVCRESVLPSELTQTIASLAPGPFLARAGNGLIWHCEGRTTPREDLSAPLFQRLKATFDPNRILPELSLE